MKHFAILYGQQIVEIQSLIYCLNDGELLAGNGVAMQRVPTTVQEGEKLLALDKGGSRIILSGFNSQWFFQDAKLVAVQKPTVRIGSLNEMYFSIESEDGLTHSCTLSDASNSWLINGVSRVSNKALVKNNLFVNIIPRSSIVNIYELSESSSHIRMLDFTSWESPLRSLVYCNAAFLYANYIDSGFTSIPIEQEYETYRPTFIPFAPRYPDPPVHVDAGKHEFIIIWDRLVKRYAIDPELPVILERELSESEMPYRCLRSPVLDGQYIYYLDTHAHVMVQMDKDSLETVDSYRFDSDIPIEIKVHDDFISVSCRGNKIYVFKKD